MVEIKKNLVPQNKYNIKCPYSMKPEGITVHNTANDASAKNEIAYMIRNDAYNSFHFAVDDKEIVQGLPLDRNGFHASDGSTGEGNRKTIGIEICYSKSGGDRFIKAEQNAVDLIVHLIKKYKWDISRVKRHYDYAPDKKDCPHRTISMGWDRFLNMINSKLNGSTPSNIDLPNLSGYSGSSLVDGLKSVLYDSSFNSRANLYKNAGYTDIYKGTATQNINLLNKLKENKTKSPTIINYYKKYNGSSSSLVDALKAIGVVSSFSNRKKIAKINDISNYTGTAQQNIKLLSLLKNGKLKK